MMLLEQVYRKVKRSRKKEKLDFKSDRSGTNRILQRILMIIRISNISLCIARRQVINNDDHTVPCISWQSSATLLRLIEHERSRPYPIPGRLRRSHTANAQPTQYRLGTARPVCGHRKRWRYNQRGLILRCDRDHAGIPGTLPEYDSGSIKPLTY